MNKFAAIAFAAASVLILLSTSYAQSRHCSAALVAGKWAFTTTGTIPIVGPVSAVGIFTADSSGNLVGSQTRSLNGDIADETFTGTATVNADCTGVDVIQVYESGVLVRTTTLNLVYDDNGRGARAIFRSLVLPNGANLPTVLTIEARKIFSGTQE